MEVIARAGDVNPFLHGGGVVLKNNGKYYSGEYTQGLEEGETVCVYSFYIEKKLPSWLNNEDIEHINMFTGREGDGNILIENLSEKDDWSEWLNAYIEIGLFFGFINFDENPFYFKEEELDERWKLNV